MIPSHPFIERPWRGPCATTGKTVEQFTQELTEFEPQTPPMPDWVRAAAVHICRSYGLQGSCDPMYVANVINNNRPRTQEGDEHMMKLDAQRHDIINARNALQEAGQ